MGKSRQVITKRLWWSCMVNMILNKPRRRKLKMEGRVMYLANSDMPWKWYQWDIVQVWYLGPGSTDPLVLEGLEELRKCILLFEPSWIIYLKFNQQFLGLAWLTILDKMSAQNFSKHSHFPFFPFIHCCCVFCRWVIGIHQRNILKIFMNAIF